MSEIIVGRLWQCGDWDLEEEVAKAKPTAIVNLTYSSHMKSNESCILIEYPMQDDEIAKVNQRRLHEVVDIVVGMVNGGGRVVVHCNAGLNRSGLVVALALCRIGSGMTGKQAVETVRICRGEFALCNASFRGYIKNLYPENKAPLITMPDHGVKA